ncbi:MAG TPA: hypothetical protein VK453_14280 [Micromonosporaceae bacterium]|nr:hypothetical protein [Micromonosporaceae bacterium]
MAELASGNALRRTIDIRDRPTSDIDARVAAADPVPTELAGALGARLRDARRYLRATPQPIQTRHRDPWHRDQWREEDELSGRDVVPDGRWVISK